MKITIGCVAIVTTLLAGSIVLAAEENNNEDWLNKHAVTVTTSTTECDANNNIKSIKVVKDTTIYIKQTSTEIQKPDAKGNIQTVSRTTTSLDTLGGSATITESLLPGSSTLVTTSIKTVEITPEGKVTTTLARNKNGSMGVTSRNVAVIKKNGTAPSVVLP
ncbi:MAG: hypothetical protein PHI84_04310 [Kiritimatiellae bacterium]|nr:hypothetical protein [Kiritimatiellia bacterium]